MGRKRSPDDPNQMSLWGMLDPLPLKQETAPLNGHPKPKLLDREKAKAVTEDAIDRASRLADWSFKQTMDDAIIGLAREGVWVANDYVWDRIGYVGNIHLGGRDNGSGLGPRLRSWQKAGLIEYVRQRQSDRDRTHRHWKGLWRSLVYAPPEENKP